MRTRGFYRIQHALADKKNSVFWPVKIKILNSTRLKVEFNDNYKLGFELFDTLHIAKILLFQPNGNIVAIIAANISSPRRSYVQAEKVPNTNFTARLQMAQQLFAAKQDDHDFQVIAQNLASIIGSSTDFN